MSSLKENRYLHVTNMIRYHNDKMTIAFIRFVSLITSIVGGFLFLISQEKIKIEFKELIVFIFPYLISFISISTFFIVWSNWFSWYGFRKSEAKIIAEANIIDHSNVPFPKLPRACKEQIIVSVIIVATASASFVLTPYILDVF